ncbi:hypothetical protein BGW41_003009 [Actinomortierella wolfii]|nr:hypothetical protein BGW41_003009 [Actinomortierella wolfii]
MEEAKEASDDHYPQKRGSTTDFENDEQLYWHLAKSIFRGRPTHVEKRALHYLVRMRLKPSPKPDEFFTYIKQVHPRAKLSAVAWVWGQLKDYFNGTEGSDYSLIEPLADVPALIAAFKAAPYMDQNVPSINNNEVDRTDRASAPSITASNPTSLARSSGRSSTTSSSSLSSMALENMKTEFDDHFNAFPGESWILSSGVSLDDILRTHILTLTKESALHSFVIEDVASLLRLVTEESDKKDLKSVLVERVGEKHRDLSESEKSYLELYNKGPSGVEELLDNGWKNVASTSSLITLPDVEFRKDIDFALRYIHMAYAQVEFHLPSTQSESWFLWMVWGFLGHFLSSKGTLEYQPGEASLKASAWRKNKGRGLESKQGQGRKVDGIVSSYETRLELCVIEAARVDNGPTGTKALTDSRKLAKSMKDMHDLIRSRSSTNIGYKLTTFGLRIAASSISFYTLRQRRGRFYQLACDACVSLPPGWKPSGSTTTSILTVVSLLLRFKAQMIDMANQITEWTSGAILIPDTTNNGDAWASTLTTPPSSPRLSPRVQ